MEAQLRQFAEHIEAWTAHEPHRRQIELLEWFKGNMPLPHPEWGPATTIQRSLQFTTEPPKIRNALVESLSAALIEVGRWAGWNGIQRSAVLEMLTAAAEMGPSPALANAVRPLITHAEIGSTPDLANALRHALMFNQTDQALADFWLELLDGHPQGGLKPAPLSDIRGLLRLGRPDEPSWRLIATGIGLFSRQFAGHRERRTLFHDLWTDFAMAWNKHEADPDWSLTCIMRGVDAGWATWVFETLPSLYGRRTDGPDDYFIWTAIAGVLENAIEKRCNLPPAPVAFIRWKSSSREERLKREINIMRIESKRRQYSHFSSEPLAGIIFDTAARWAEASAESRQQFAPANVPSTAERWEMSKQLLCAAG